MASPASSHDGPPTVIRDVLQTPNSKIATGASKSRIRGQIQNRVLFPLDQPQEQQDHRRQRAQPQHNWSNVEVGALSLFISQEMRA